MPHSTIKHPLTFSLFVGMMSTIAIFCTLGLLYITVITSEETEYDNLILWAGILPLSLLLSIFLGKHCYRKTAPEYINTVFKGKMAIAYSVLISLLIAMGIFYVGIFLTAVLDGFGGSSFHVIKLELSLFALVCLSIGITSGVYCYKSVKASVVDGSCVES